MEKVEEIKVEPSNGNPEEKKPNPDVVMTIVFSGETGQLKSVMGPGDGQVYNEAVCDLMLKKAARHIESNNLHFYKLLHESKQPKIKPRIWDKFIKK